MSTTAPRATASVPAAPAPPAPAPASTVTRRLTALGRAELTLLVRNRNNLFVALLMPLLMVFLLRSSLGQLDADDLPMGTGAATLIGGTGMILLLVAHMSPVSALVARREELVLKRLRTGETSDAEILIGCALPAATLALAQCAVLTAAGVAVLGVPAPARPDLLLLGVAAAIVLLAGLAALTTVITRTVESAGLTTLPLFLVSCFGSGLFLPRDTLPPLAADLCGLLPLSGVMEFVRAGWLGTAHAGSLLGAGINTVAWGVLTGWAVRRWFRWEPRR